jgi:hypothetical protein
VVKTHRFNHPPLPERVYAKGRSDKGGEARKKASVKKGGIGKEFPVKDR